MINTPISFEKEKQLFSSKTISYLIIGIFLAFCLLYIVKSCSSNSSIMDYHIGQDSRWRGLGLMGKERNLTAFNTDLLTAIAKQENIHILVSIEPTSELIEKVEQGKLQGALTTLKPAYSNNNDLIFSDPYFLLGPVLIIPSTAPIEGWNEMAKKIIGVQSNSPAI